MRIHWIAETGDDASTTRVRRAHAPARSASTTAANALAAAVDIARVVSVRFGSVRFGSFVPPSAPPFSRAPTLVVVVVAGTPPSPDTFTTRVGKSYLGFINSIKYVWF